MRVLGVLLALLVSVAATRTSAKPAKSVKSAKSPKPGPAAADPIGRGKAPADVDALLAGLARAPGLYARFTEEKHLTLLQQPLVTTGSIYFAPPARFARVAEKPIPSTLVVDGNQLRFGNADGQESMNLGANPVARLFADAFVMLLSGNRAGLEKIFKMQLVPAPGGEDWRLLLTPRVAPMDKMIKDLELRAHGLIVRELTVRESNGDWTRTTFSDVDLDRRYSAADQARIFNLPAK